MRIDWCFSGAYDDRLKKLQEIIEKDSLYNEGIEQFLSNF